MLLAEDWRNIITWVQVPEKFAAVSKFHYQLQREEIRRRALERFAAITYNPRTPVIKTTPTWITTPKLRVTDIYYNHYVHGHSRSSKVVIRFDPGPLKGFFDMLDRPPANSPKGTKAVYRRTLDRVNYENYYMRFEEPNIYFTEIDVPGLDHQYSAEPYSTKLDSVVIHATPTYTGGTVTVGEHFSYEIEVSGYHSKCTSLMTRGWIDFP